MTVSVALSGHNLKKVFNRRVIFEDISFSLHPRQTLLITGPNGSGKSTLVKMISGVLTPTNGEVKATLDGDKPVPMLCSIIGFVSPYLQMYEEFSACENLQFALAVRGMTSLRSRIRPLLEHLQLQGRLDDPVRTFSSGMKQRVKYAFALIHQPPILILDEPMANLDSSGVEMVRRIMQEQQQEGLLIIATNDVTDVDRFDYRVDLGSRQ
jgi:heme exporter protein A